MKKMISLMLVAMLIVTCFATVAAAASGASVTVGYAETQPDNTVTIPVTVSSESGFACFQMHVSVVAPLEIIEISGAVGNPATGAVSFITSDGKNTNSHTFTLTVKVPAEATVGTYGVNVSVDYVTDANLAALSVGSSAGAVKIPCQHKWGEWIVAEEATCEKDGSKTRSCEICLITEEAVIPATGHAWGEWETSKPATCVGEGEQTRKCANCGETETQKLPATGVHVWGEWKTTKEATCIVEGSAERVCSTCNEVETKVLPKGEHTWGKNWEKDDTNHWHVCDVCGEKNDEAAHIYGMWQVGKEPTETEAGWRYKVCEACGHTVTRTVEYDAPPPTGDVTPIVTFGVISMLAAAAYVSKRKFAK